MTYWEVADFSRRTTGGRLLPLCSSSAQGTPLGASDQGASPDARAKNQGLLLDHVGSCHVGSIGDSQGDETPY